MNLPMRLIPIGLIIHGGFGAMEIQVNRIIHNPKSDINIENLANTTCY
jgi:hypothetical protein